MQAPTGATGVFCQRVKRTMATFDAGATYYSTLIATICNCCGEATSRREVQRPRRGQ